ncbi:MAG: type II secretion system protein J [Actinomycetota bacterium]
MRNERGLTLAEILVTVSVLSIISSGFYLVMLSGTRSSRETRSIAQVAEEARLGFNRMMRDTREADSITSPASTSYTIRVDFDHDGLYETPNAQGDYEILTYAYDATGERITLSATGAGTQTLIDGVELVPGREMFTYSSNRLEYDWDGDGVTTYAELQNAGSQGVTLTSSQIQALLSSVNFSMRILDDSCTETGSGDCARTVFYGQAQLRNKR